MGLEFTAIELVQDKAPTLLVPAILRHYVDETPRQSYTLLLSVPSEDMNEEWQTLKEQQNHNVLYQVAEHVHSLAQLPSEKLERKQEEVSV